MDDLVALAAEKGLAIYQRLGDWRDEFVLAEDNAEGRIILNGGSLADVQRFLQDER
jgi:hypothetical protein